MKRLIVTDSTSDLTGSMIRDLSVKIIPVNIIIDGIIFKDRSQIGITDFYNEFDTFKSMKTEPVSMREYLAVYRKLIRRYDEIFFIHCSRHLSKTHDHALTVHEDLETLHDCSVHVLDSKQCGIGLGMIVMEAAKALDQGKSTEEILTLIEEMSQKVITYMAVPTLKYLRDSRKISGVKSFFANMLGVKPVLGFDKGKLVVKTRLTGKSDNLLLEIIDLLKKDIGRSPVVIALAHGRDTRYVEDLKIVLKKRFQCERIFTTYFGPSIGISTGPDTIGVSFYHV